MLPTVDFCFKELMQNEKVRKGFIAALLGRKPEDIQETTLLPTILPAEYSDDKLGVLDVAVNATLPSSTQLLFSSKYPLLAAVTPNVSG